MRRDAPFTASFHYRRWPDGNKPNSFHEHCKLNLSACAHMSVSVCPLMCLCVCMCMRLYVCGCACVCRSMSTSHVRCSQLYLGNEEFTTLNQQFICRLMRECCSIMSSFLSRLFAMKSALLHRLREASRALKTRQFPIREVGFFSFPFNFFHANPPCPFSSKQPLSSPRSNHPHHLNELVR